MIPLDEPCRGSDPANPKPCQNMDAGRKALCCIRCGLVRQYERCGEVRLSCAPGWDGWCVVCGNLPEAKR